MSKVSWNEFRSLHKGTDQKKIKELWGQFKEGEYEIPTKEAPENASAPAPEAAAAVDHRKEFLSLFNKIFILEEVEGTKSVLGQLMTHAEATRPDNYTTGAGDGWTLYLGPTQKAVLVNESRQTAFSITRAYWHRFYQGAALVDTQIFEDETGIERLKKQFKRMGKFVPRYPIPGVEIQVPRSALDIPLPSGVL